MPFNTFNLDLPNSTLVIDGNRGELLSEIRNSTVIVIDGFPGVGKSTIAKYIADNISAVIIEIDHFRTTQTGSFFLTDSDENLVVDIINTASSHNRKIIIDGVLALDLVKRRNIPYDKYVWIAERDNTNNQYQFIFESYSGIRIEDCSSLEQELLNRFVELDPLQETNIFYKQETR